MKHFWEYIKTNYYRLSNVGTWKTDSDASLFIFLVSFVVISVFNFLAYIVASLVVEGRVTLIVSNMSKFEICLTYFMLIYTLAFTLLISSIIFKLYEKIIAKPVSDFNKELSNLARNDISEYYTNGKMSHPFRDPTSAITWDDRVRYYIDSTAVDKYVDELTGCFNRKYLSHKFVKYLHAQMLAKSTRTNEVAKYGDDVYAVFMVDIDHFKSVNDVYSHAAGDDVLQSVGKLLRRIAGDNGVVIRNGGEEFVIIYMAKYPFDFAEIANKINQAFRDEIKVVVSGKVVRDVTCSVGFVSYPMFKNADHIIDFSGHIDVADAAMYLSKENGRNRWHEIKSMREPTDKIDVSLFVSSPEYGLRRGYYVIRTNRGECTDLSKLSDIED